MIAPARVLLKEGELKAGLFDVQVYLFNDVLLVAKKKLIGKAPYSLKCLMLLSNATISLASEKCIFKFLENS